MLPFNIYKQFVDTTNIPFPSHSIYPHLLLVTHPASRWTYQKGQTNILSASSCCSLVLKAPNLPDSIVKPPDFAVESSEDIYEDDTSVELLIRNSLTWSASFKLAITMLKRIR